MERLIERITPFWKDRFVIQNIERENGKELYTVSAQDDRILLRGSSRSALCAAYYRALRECCGMDLSPCGNRSVYDSGEMRLPEKEIRQTFAHDLRPALCYETFIHEACAWSFDDWAWHLDYLAMQGVNAAMMPVGNEAVWYYTALDFGIRREDAMKYLSGPNYYPLQLQGKLDSFLSITDTNYLKARIELGKQITARMREVGIEPIFPAFNGHVPKYLKGYRKTAAMFIVTSWELFPFTYRLYPDDPLFAALSDALADKQTSYFGEGRFYAADPFYGVSPRVKDASIFAQYGKAITDGIQRRHPDAVWITHACEHTAALTASLPENCVCIFDPDGKYDGDQPCVHGVRLNVGGHTVLGGNCEKQVSDAPSAVFSEYSLANPLLTALCYRRISEPVSDIKTAFVQEAVRRWGSDEGCLRDAAAMLLDTCYGKDAPDLPMGSIPACRPSTSLSHTAPGDTLSLHYDNRDLCRALTLMLASEGDYTDGYVFDVCDVTRQMLSNYARRLYTAAIEGFQKRDGRLFELSTNAFLQVLRDMDALLQTRAEFNLHTHLHKVGGSAEGKTDAQNFEVTYLASLTLFGPFDTPEQYDVFWKEWSCLLGSYYAERWHEFFAYLAKSFKKRGTVSTDCAKQINGRNPSRGNGFCKSLDRTERSWVKTCMPEPVGDTDTLTLAAELLNKYKPLIEQDQI